MVDFYLMVSYASVPTTSSSTHAGPWVIDLVLFNAKRHPDLPAVSGKKFFLLIFHIYINKYTYCPILLTYTQHVELNGQKNVLFLGVGRG